MSIAARIAGLTTIWVLAWGRLTIGNVLGGVAVASLLLVTFPTRRAEGARYGTRPRYVAFLVVRFLGRLVIATLLVAREVLSRRSRIRTGIVACPLQQDDETTLTVVASLIALTPGTMAVEIEQNPPVIFVHVLLLSDIGHVREDVARTEALVLAAFPPRHGPIKTAPELHPGGRR